MTQLNPRWKNSHGFTLVELLIVILIISLLTAMTMTAMSGAVQEGKRQRARVQISKIDALIMEKWNSYRFRQVPIRIPSGIDLRTGAFMRLSAIRELMRMELPDRMSDITWIDSNTGRATTILPSRPALSAMYYNTTGPNPNQANEQAECLYLILRQMRDGDRSAINFFLDSEVGDTDNDGLKEILDPWGKPIRFLRWAPGYSIGIPDWGTDPNYNSQNLYKSGYQPLTTQNMNATLYSDPFDPIKADLRLSPIYTKPPVFIIPFALKPLIFSAGPDGSFDVICGYAKYDQASGKYAGPPDFNYATTSTMVISQTSPPANIFIRNDPYYVHKHSDGPDSGKNTPWLGACMDIDGDNELGFFDNITNHDIVLEGQ